MSEQQPPGGSPPPGHGQPPYGQQPSYGGQPSYGQPVYGQQPGQPPQPPPGYGQPPGGPFGAPQHPGPDHGSGNGRKLLILGGAAVAAVVVVVIGLVLLLGGGDGPGETPEASADAFMTALVDGDCDTASELVTDSLAETLGACDASTPGGLPSGVGAEPGDAEVIEEDADTATVRVPMEFEDGEIFSQLTGSFSFSLDLVKEDDGWLVDDFGFGGLEDFDFESQLEELEDQLGDLPSDFPTEGFPAE